MIQTLKVPEIVVPVKIGVETSERVNFQYVYISLEINFRKKNRAIITDNIEDTICYDRLSKSILSFCSTKEFKLIENLAHEVFLLVQKKLDIKDKLIVGVKKKFNNIDYLPQGVEFIISN